MAEAFPNGSEDDWDSDNKVPDFNSPLELVPAFVEGDFEIKFDVDLSSTYYSKFEGVRPDGATDLLAVQYLLARDDCVQQCFVLYIRPLSGNEVVRVHDIGFQTSNSSVHVMPVHPIDATLYASHKHVLAICKIQLTANAQAQMFKTWKLYVSMFASRIEQPQAKPIASLESPIGVSLYQQREELGDISFVNVGAGYELKVHKAILQASSDGLKKLIGTKMKENETKEIETNMTKQAMETCIAILYHTGIPLDKFEGLNKHILEVMLFLDMYLVKEAENIIVQWFHLSNPSAKLCFRILTLAQRFGWTKLTQAAGARFQSFLRQQQDAVLNNCGEFNVEEVTGLLSAMSLENPYCHF